MSSFLISIDDIEEFRWPVVRETPKAELVQTPGGEVWIPKRNSRLIRRFAANRLGEFLDGLARLHAGSRDALIAVRRRGKGPTDKSAIFEFEVEETALDGARTIRPRTFTLPLSLVADGHVQRWVIDEKLDRERRQGRTGGRLQSPVVAPWPGLDTIRLQLEAVIEADCGERERGRQRWEAERPAREAAERAEDERRREQEESLRTAREEKAERAAQAKAKRDTSSLIVEGCTVHWTDWVGPQAARRLVGHDETGVTVVIRGQFAELRWPGTGRERKKKLDSKEFRIEAPGGWDVVAGGVVQPEPPQPDMIT